MSAITHHLRCGLLTLDVAHTEVPLDELCTFGSRRNRKRGFLIISKVLGKHVPVRPATMAHIHTLLAEKVRAVEGPVVVLALAETAIGLGQGIFERLLELTNRKDGLFLHSTRYRLDRPQALTFRESHSHATEHLLYLPDDPAKSAILHEARTLVLVDDEITTGRTLTDLAAAYLKQQPRVREIHYVCITDWLDEQGRRRIGEVLDRRVVYHSLVGGRLTFAAAPEFDPGPMPDVTGKGDYKDAVVSPRFGRLGLRGALDWDFTTLQKEAELRGGERVLVLGTGEFTHLPFRFARHLEAGGWDVHYQSTTRSPVLVGEGIASALEFTDNYHDDIPNYVYNVADRHYDRILVCYETQPLPAAHRLLELVGGKGFFFHDGERGALAPQ